MAISLVAVDTGRSSTKVVTEGTRDAFPSVLGEYRILKNDRRMTRSDMVVKYEGLHYYVGEVAKDESVAGAQMMLTTKAHLDTKIFTLSALHRVLPSDSNVFLIVGEPIANHTSLEKLKMKQMLLGEHKITVNGEEKSFYVSRVEVAAECATAGWAMRKSGKFHVVDPGSRTVNFATIENGKWIDKYSGSLDYGLETVSNISLSMFTRMVVADLSKTLRSLSDIILIGGKANILLDYFKQYTTQVESYPDGLYANAQAFYDLGVHALETAKTQLQV